MENNEINKYDAFDKSIQSKIIDIDIDLAEGILDSITKSKLLESLPIIKTLNSLIGIGNSLRQYYFFKKIFRFLFELDKVSPKDKQRFINELDKSNQKKRIYDNLLLIIDRLDEEKKASIAGKLFKAAIESKLDLLTFFRLLNVVEKIFFNDLEIFLEYNRPKKSIDDILDEDIYYGYRQELVKENLANYGLFTRSYEQDKSINRITGAPSEKVVISGYEISTLGRDLIKYCL